MRWRSCPNFIPKSFRLSTSSNQIKDVQVIHPENLLDFILWPENPAVPPDRPKGYIREPGANLGRPEFRRPASRTFPAPGALMPGEQDDIGVGPPRVSSANGAGHSPGSALAPPHPVAPVGIPPSVGRSQTFCQRHRDANLPGFLLTFHSSPDSFEARQLI